MMRYGCSSQFPRLSKCLQMVMLVTVLNGSGISIEMAHYILIVLHHYILGLGMALPLHTRFRGGFTIAYLVFTITF